MLSASRIISRNLFTLARNPSHESSILSKCSCHLRRSSSVEQEPKTRKSISGYVQDFRKSSNFKYWVIGVSVISSWLSYYGVKTYKKSRIHVCQPPPIPNHDLVVRSSYIEELFKLHKSTTKQGGRLKIFYLSGPPGYGKSILAYDFAKELLKRRDWTRYSIPKSDVIGFFNMESNESFLLSLKSFAFSVGIKQGDLNGALKDGQKFSNLGFMERCDVLLQLTQEALKKHSGWFLAFDNMKSNVSKDIVQMLDSWFLKDEAASKWSSGTIVLTYDGSTIPNRKFKEFNCSNGLDKTETMELFCNLAKVEDINRHSTKIGQLNTLLHGNPLALTCAAMWVKNHLTKQQIVSIEEAVDVFIETFQGHFQSCLRDSPHLKEFAASESGRKLFAVETCIAMTAKDYSDDDTFLQHTFDLVGYSHPFSKLPLMAISRHLRNPFYKLPELKVTSSLDIVSAYNQAQSAPSKKHDQLLEPEGKAWSVKRLTERLESIESYFSESWTIVKELYNYYFGTLDLNEKGSDGLNFVRECILFNSCKIQPGDTEAMCVHPLVYAVLRQHFLYSSLSAIEMRHIDASKELFEQQSWLRKLKKFDESSILQSFRKDIGETLSAHAAKVTADTSALNACNSLGVNVGSVLDNSNMERYDVGTLVSSADDKFRHTRAHIQRVLTTLCDASSLTKSNAAGRAQAAALSLNIHNILTDMQPSLVTAEARVEGIKAIAACLTDVYDDHRSAKQLLEEMLLLQGQQSGTHTLAYACSLTRLAAIENADGNTEKCIELLEKASEIYETQRKKSGEYKEPLEYARSLELRGVVTGTVGKKTESKELIERSLMLQQAAPPDMSDEARSKQYGAEFASSLTDLGHAYLSLGLAIYGRKILDLSLAANKNLHGDNHPEVVRTLTTLSIAHLMLGHNEESRKLDKEAGKCQSAINKSLPLL